MVPRVARNIASRSHSGQRDRFGEPVVEHVARPAGAVPTRGRAVAWLHDLLAHGWLPPEAPPYAWARRYLSRLSVERSLHSNRERASILQDPVG